MLESSTGNAAFCRGFSNCLLTNQPRRHLAAVTSQPLRTRFNSRCLPRSRSAAHALARACVWTPALCASATRRTRTAGLGSLWQLEHPPQTPHLRPGRKYRSTMPAERRPLLVYTLAFLRQLIAPQEGGKTKDSRADADCCDDAFHQPNGRI